MEAFRLGWHFVWLFSPLPSESSKRCLQYGSKGLMVTLKCVILLFPYDQLKFQLYMKVMEKINFLFYSRVKFKFHVSLCFRL